MKTLNYECDHFLNTYDVPGTLSALYKHHFIDLHLIFTVTLEASIITILIFKKWGAKKLKVEEPGFKTKQPGSKPHAFNHTTYYVLKHKNVMTSANT